MMMILKKKEVLIAALILLIAAAAYINFNYSPDYEDSVVANSDGLSAETGADEFDSANEEKKLGDLQLVSANSKSDYFSEARMSRDNAHSRTKDELKEIIENGNVDEKSKKSAEDRLLALAQTGEKEAACENMIKAKGFKDAIVYITGETASITVNSEGLSSADIAKIQDIVKSQTSIETKNIKIVEVTK